MSSSLRVVSLIALAGSVVFASGCRIETHDGDDECDGNHGSRSGASGGNASSGGAGNASSGGAASGGHSGGFASDPCNVDTDCDSDAYCDQHQCVPGDPCASEDDCAAGFNCYGDPSVCLPAAGETCPELDENACSGRWDCEVIYAGVDCSCGSGCECMGGEPGCVCESFDFFRCESLLD